MTRLMHDSDIPAAIPGNAAMVAGYIDHSNPWTPADWARFPNAVHVRIARGHTTNDGHAGDCEPGLMTPQQLVSWVRLRRSAGADPTGYCSTGQVVSGGVAYGWAACRAAFAAAATPEPHWWVAAYPGAGAVIPAGAVAHQYADPATSGGHYDLSVVADYWPGVDGGDMPITQQDAQMVAAEVWQYVSRNPSGNDSEQAIVFLDWLETRIRTGVAADVKAQLAALQTAQTAEIGQEEAALLAAVKAVTIAPSDPAATAAALNAAGLPAAVAGALLAVLAKAGGS